MKKVIIGLALLLAACGGSDNEKTNIPSRIGWDIGPTIDGKNYSKGLPRTPTKTQEGWEFSISPTEEPHYITTEVKSLSGKSEIVLDYEIKMADGTQIYPKCCINSPAMGPTLYLQMLNDDWQEDGKRWFATFSTPTPIKAGVQQVSARLDGPWTSVHKMTAITNPNEFKKAKENIYRVGFVLGGGDGYGHGVRATGPVTFVIKDFRIR